MAQRCVLSWTKYLWRWTFVQFKNVNIITMMRMARKNVRKGATYKATGAGDNDGPAVEQQQQKKKSSKKSVETESQWMGKVKEGTQVKNASGRAGSGRRFFFVHLCFGLHKTSSGVYIATVAVESNLSKWYSAIVCLSVSLFELIHSLEPTTRNTNCKKKDSVCLGHRCQIILSLYINRKYVHFPVVSNVCNIFQCLYMKHAHFHLFSTFKLLRSLRFLHFSCLTFSALFHIVLMLQMLFILYIT